MKGHEMYEIVVTNSANESGYFSAHATLDGKHIVGSVRLEENRDTAIEQVREFIAWHRNYDDSTEKIPA